MELLFLANVSILYFWIIKLTKNFDDNNKSKNNGEAGQIEIFTEIENEWERSNKKWIKLKGQLSVWLLKPLCDSYPQMSLFVRWNNNLKNTHFSVTW